MLLNAGADTNTVDPRGFSLYQAVVGLGHRDMIDSLLSKEIEKRFNVKIFLNLSYHADGVSFIINTLNFLHYDDLDDTDWQVIAFAKEMKSEKLLAMLRDAGVDLGE